MSSCVKLVSQFRPAAVSAVLPALDELAKDLAALVAREGERDMMGCLKRYFFEANNVFLFGGQFEGLGESRPSPKAAKLLEATEKTTGNILKTDNGMGLWRLWETPAYR